MKKKLEKTKSNKQQIGCVDRSYTDDMTLVAASSSTTAVQNVENCNVFCAKWYFRYSFFKWNYYCGCSSIAYKGYATVFYKPATCTGYETNEIICKY